ncbi:MAG: serine protease [Rhodospirillales bacterium]|nr:serine protease [Rhodospirillales bacterium]
MKIGPFFKSVRKRVAETIGGYAIGAVFYLVVVIVSGADFSDFWFLKDPSQGDQKLIEKKPPALWFKETEDWDIGSSNAAPIQTQENYRLPLGSMVMDHPENKGTWSSGTAFAIEATQYWATARHVVEDCSDIYLLIDKKNGKFITVKGLIVAQDRRVDAAILKSIKPLPARTPLSLRSNSNPNINGFTVGFPKGNPGALHGKHLGWKWLKHKGRWSGKQEVDMWAEVSSLPQSLTELGGISGGVLMDENQDIAGITIGGSPRRGRFSTTRVPDVKRILSIAGIQETTLKYTSSQVVTDKNYPTIARNLIRSARVVKVVCKRDS